VEGYQDKVSVAEVAKVRDTAARIADGDSADGGDQVRVLAGLIQQLAAQVEVLAGGLENPLSAE